MVSWVYTEKSTLLDKRQKLNGKLNILSSFGNNEKNTIWNWNFRFEPNKPSIMYIICTIIQFKMIYLINLWIHCHLLNQDKEENVLCLVSVGWMHTWHLVITHQLLPYFVYNRIKCCSYVLSLENNHWCQTEHVHTTQLLLIIEYALCYLRYLYK